MPYHITSEAGKFEVVDDKGKVMGTHPTRKQAVAQLQALYANVPDSKKEVSESEKASKDSGDYLIVEDSEAPTTWHLQVKKNGTPDHGLMGAAWAALHEGYRGNKYEGPDKGKALDKLKKLYEAEKMDTPATKEMQEVQPSLIDRVIAAIKGDKPGHEFRGNQFGHSVSGERANATVGEQAQKIDMEIDSKINQLRSKYPQLGDAYNQMNFGKIQSDYDVEQVGNILTGVNHAENRNVFSDNEIRRAKERAMESDRYNRKINRNKNILENQKMRRCCETQSRVAV